MNVGSSVTIDETTITMNKPFIPLKQDCLCRLHVRPGEGTVKSVTPATQAYLGARGFWGQSYGIAFASRRIVGFFCCGSLPGSGSDNAPTRGTVSLDASLDLDFPVAERSKFCCRYDTQDLQAQHRLEEYHCHNL